MSEVARLVIGMGLDPRDFNRGLNNVTGTLSDFRSTLLQGLGLGSVAAGITLATRSALEFGDEMRKVQSLVGDTAEVEKMAASVRALSREFGIARGDEQRALFTLVQEGARTAAEAIEDLTSVNVLARASFSDVATAAEAVTTVFDAFGKGAGTAAEVSDQLFQAARSGETSLADLSKSLGDVAPLANSAGIGLQELLAATATISSQGGTAARALVGLRSVIAGLLDVTPETAKAARTMGLDFSLAALQAKGFGAFMADVANKTGGNVQKLQALFGSIRELTPALRLASEDGAVFNRMLEAQAAASGKAQKASDGLAESTEQEFARLRASVADGLLVVGTAILRILVPAVRTLVNGFAAITDAAKATALAVGVAGLAGALLSLGKVLTGIRALALTASTILSLVPAVSSLRDVMTLATAASSGFFASLLTPTTAIVVGIGLIAAAFYGVLAAERAAREEFEKFRDDLKNLDPSELMARSVDIAPQLDRARRAVREAQADLAKNPESKAAIGELQEAEKHLAGLEQRAKALGVQYNIAADLARELGRATKDAEKPPTGATGVDSADAFLKSIKERTALLLEAERQLGLQSSIVFPALPSELIKLYDTATQALAAQRGQINETSGALLGLVRQLERSTTIMAHNAIEGKVKIDPPQIRDILSTFKKIELPAELSVAPPSTRELGKLAGQVQRVMDARGLLDFSKLTGDTAFVSEAAAALKRSEQDFRNFARDMANNIRASGAPADKVREQIDALNKALRELGIDPSARTFRENIEGIADTVLEITGAARGLGQVAQAMGKIGDKAAEALDKVVDLLGGLAQLTKGLASGDLSSVISGSIATLGSLLSLSGIGESEAQKEAKQIQKENNARLRELAQELEGFSSSLGNISRVAKAVSDLRIQTLADNARGERGTFGDAELERLHKALNAAGLSYADVARVAEDMGIKLRDSAGNLIGGAFAALAKALELQVKLLTQFGDSLDEQRRRTELRNEVFDVDDTPLQRFNDALSLLATQSDALRAAFGDIDVSTVSGRAAAEAILRDFVKRLEAGSITAAEFEKFGGKDEFIEWLMTADDALDDFNDATRAATKGLLNVPDGIKLAAFQFNAMAARTIAELAPPVQPVPAAPPPTPGTPTAPGATGPSILFQFAEGSVVVTADGGDPKTIARGVISELMAEARAQFGDGSQWSRVVLN